MKDVRFASRIKRGGYAFEDLRWKPIVGSVERLAKRGPLPVELVELLRVWREAASPRKLTAQEEVKLREADAIILDEDASWSKSSRAFETWERFKRLTTPLKEERKLLERLDALLGVKQRGDDDDDIEIIPPDDAIGAAVAADRAPKGPAAGAAWGALLRHALGQSATTPSPKWTAKARELIGRIDADAFAARVRDWFARAGSSADSDRPGAFGHAVNRSLLNDQTADLVKGLSWTIVAAGRADLAPSLGTLAERCFEKVKDHGPRNVRAANAAVGALAALAHPQAGAQLVQLRPRVKHPSSRKVIDKALVSLSKATGLTIDELGEIAVPTFGLALADFAGDGAKLPRDAAKALAAQSVRVERLFMSDRTWNASDWRER
jgi:hypothetical protein